MTGEGYKGWHTYDTIDIQVGVDWIHLENSKVFVSYFLFYNIFSAFWNRSCIVHPLKAYYFDFCLQIISFVFVSLNKINTAASLGCWQDFNLFRPQDSFKEKVPKINYICILSSSGCSECPHLEGKWKVCHYILPVTASHWTWIHSVFDLTPTSLCFVVLNAHTNGDKSTQFSKWTAFIQCFCSLQTT